MILLALELLAGPCYEASMVFKFRLLEPHLSYELELHNWKANIMRRAAKLRRHLYTTYIFTYTHICVHANKHTHRYKYVYS